MDGTVRASTVSPGQPAGERVGYVNLRHRRLTGQALPGWPDLLRI